MRSIRVDTLCLRRSEASIFDKCLWSTCLEEAQVAVPSESEQGSLAKFAFGLGRRHSMDTAQCFRHGERSIEEFLDRIVQSRQQVWCPNASGLPAEARGYFLGFC